MPHAAFPGGFPRDKVAWRIVACPAHHAPRSCSIYPACWRHRHCAELPGVLLLPPLLQHKPLCSVPAAGAPGGVGTAWLPRCREASPPPSGALLGGHVTLGSCPHLRISLEKTFDSFSLVCDSPKLQSCKTWERFAWDRSWPPYPRGTATPERMVTSPEQGVLACAKCSALPGNTDRAVTLRGK